jgi:hypothetical protein
MGAGLSGRTDAALLVLAAGVLFLAVKNNQVQRELHSLRNLLEASVSLYELEEQVMPAIDSLEQETAKLQREMQTLTREAMRWPEEKRGARAARSPAEVAEACKEEPRGGDSEELALGSFGDIADLSLPSLLMGSLMAGRPALSAAGVSTARVLLVSSDAHAAPLLSTDARIESDCEEEPDGALRYRPSDKSRRPVTGTYEGGEPSALPDGQG